MARKDPDVTTTKVYFPQEGQIQVHRQCVTRSPPALVTVYYWYGPKKRSEKVPQWIRDLTKADENDATPTPMDDTDGSSTKKKDLLD